MTSLPSPCAPDDELGPHVPVLALHHIGVVVGDIRQAREEYVTTLGYEMCTEVIHDTIQTAHVQFLRLPGDAVYLELVSPDGGGSKLAGALRRGGGLNHLCFATDDMGSCWTGLRARGWFPLQHPVPAVAFSGRRIAWFLGRDRIPVEVVERGVPGEL